ncbi:Rhodanese-like protein [Lichtheimia hyalospora FSU 10163]|nr:Rhodanese-like protein [Lichtheimia hyalospora FSU 10163]
MFSITIKQVAAAAAVQRRAFSSTPAYFSRWTDMVKDTRDTLNIGEITADELDIEMTNNAKKPVIIDVREITECEQLGKIPSAVNLSRGVLELGVEKVVTPESGNPVVLYCAGGLRSIMAAGSLIRMGYDKENVKSLKGGFAAWKKSGYQVDKGN